MASSGISTHQTTSAVSLSLSENSNANFTAAQTSQVPHQPPTQPLNFSSHDSTNLTAATIPIPPPISQSLSLFPYHSISSTVTNPNLHFSLPSTITSLPTSSIFAPQHFLCSTAFPSSSINLLHSTNSSPLSIKAHPISSVHPSPHLPHQISHQSPQIPAQAYYSGHFSGSPLGSPQITTRPTPLLSSLNQGSPVKLDGDNFLTWESTVMPLIHGHRLDGHILGTKTVPPEYILDSSDQVCPNPLYDDWVATDQLLLG
ncbi:hypothetical protein QN277_002415 [Acacia crassicarpa]|uniref:Retrotransposon Copia-like N-terminal domain-containing protein n=1 Tax=Acacia crassicarpa TaxID=499986 RepID=A0AAE1N996_9FABA|nr:hypothetical protein QN277_002415 [Acacia crassicarpa]